MSFCAPRFSRYNKVPYIHKVRVKTTIASDPAGLCPASSIAEVVRRRARCRCRRSSVAADRRSKLRKAPRLSPREVGARNHAPCCPRRPLSCHRELLHGGRAPARLRVSRSSSLRRASQPSRARRFFNCMLPARFVRQARKQLSRLVAPSIALSRPLRARTLLAASAPQAPRRRSSCVLLGLVVLAGFFLLVLACARTVRIFTLIRS